MKYLSDEEIKNINFGGLQTSSHEARKLIAKVASDDAYQKVREFIKDYYASPTVMTANQFKKKWGIWNDNPWICLNEWLKGKETE